ncbi:MAG: hypothetical protein JRI68_28900 [Deltaproteobacteria bacterium]|nr:hypothetical protein [Deltaproteobacteria bacterium]
MKSWIFAVLVPVLVCFAGGCGGMRYGFIEHGCGPADGPGLQVRLSTHASHCEIDGAGASLLLDLFGDGVPISAPQVVAISAQSASAQLCEANRPCPAPTRADVVEQVACPSEGQPGPCTRATAGQIVFDTFDEGVQATGSYDLTLDDGRVVHGSFDVRWCPARFEFCG